MKNLIYMLILVSSVFLVYADDMMTPEEFSLLNESELTDWNMTLDSIIDEGQDLVYYFSMNSYYLWEDNNNTKWIIPVRNVYYTQCYEGLDCSEFFESTLYWVQFYELDYFREIQAYK